MPEVDAKQVIGLLKASILEQALALEALETTLAPFKSAGVTKHLDNVLKKIEAQVQAARVKLFSGLLLEKLGYNFAGKSATLVESDYILSEDSAWFMVKDKYSVWVHGTDEGLSVDVYAKGKEDDDSALVASCAALDYEVDEVLKA